MRQQIVDAGNRVDVGVKRFIERVHERFLVGCSGGRNGIISRLATATQTACAN